MNTIVAQMTTQELRELINAVIEHQLTKLLDNFEARRNEVKNLGRDLRPSQPPVTLTNPSELQPLPVLPGYVPSHWKEAIYHEVK